MSRILIVDDDPDGSEVVARYLRRCGHTVDWVPSGRDAMIALIDSKPAAVVLDLRMPNMDGLMLLSVMRSYLRWTELPVVLLSAHLTDEQTLQAKAMGVQHVFHKAQFKLDELGAVVNQIVGVNPQPD